MDGDIPDCILVDAMSVYDVHIHYTVRIVLHDINASDPEEAEEKGLEKIYEASVEGELKNAEVVLVERTRSSWPPGSYEYYKGL